MSDWLDVLAYLDLIDPIEGFVSTFRFADWKGAYRRAGWIGLGNEFLASLVALNCWSIWVQRGQGWNGIEIEALLKRHGVTIWGRGFLGDQIFFRVKKRQARWAEYLLLRAGVPVTSVLNEPRNVEWTEDYAPGSEPPTRAAHSGFDLVEFFRELFR